MRFLCLFGKKKKKASEKIKVEVLPEKGTYYKHDKLDCSAYNAIFVPLLLFSNWLHDDQTLESIKPPIKSTQRSNLLSRNTKYEEMHDNIPHPCKRGLCQHVKRKSVLTNDEGQHYGLPIQYLIYMETILASPRRTRKCCQNSSLYLQDSMGSASIHSTCSSRSFSGDWVKIDGKQISESQTKKNIRKACH